jgi:alkanesulfonate monooxygenase SsuD/methylene tetrahydromethanopterin reductase-like flavin-dependent oxidoreductase (luciferase family)
MELAARLGVAFCLSLFLDADSAEAHAVIDAYRKTFVQSEHMAAPKWAIAVAGACASSAEKAKALAAEPASFVFPSVVGSPSECRDICTRLCEQYETTDLVFADVCRDKEAHRESLLSLASALGATAPAED